MQRRQSLPFVQQRPLWRWFCVVGWVVCVGWLFFFDGTAILRGVACAESPSSHTLPLSSPSPLSPPPPLSTPSKKRASPQKWGGNEIGVSGLVGSWGSSPQFGLRGVLPLSRFLAFRVGWILMFHLKGEESYNLSTFTLDLIVRLPSPYKALRYYAVTRLDFWPLWNFFNTSPAVSKISSQPTFGLSVLAGIEGFLLPRVSWFLESGFSSGMVIGFAPIRRPYEAFGFVIQSGFQTYF